MRFTLSLLLLLFFSSSLMAQKTRDWDRVYTFDDSVIDLNTLLVTLISKDVARIRFRWTFNQPESLREDTGFKYKSRLEMMEVNCSSKRYRPYHITFFDEAEKLLRTDTLTGEWRPVTFGSVMEKLFMPACKLVRTKTHGDVVERNRIELEQAANYAYSFAQHLEETKDFKSIVDKFFVADYLNRYLHDNSTNWFLNLDRGTASKVSRDELQRFYVALMNSAYLTSMHLISQHPSESEESVAPDNLIPRDVLHLISNHQYAAAYKGNESNYNFLAQNIGSVQRLQSYTDLLEQISSLMRKHLKKSPAEHSKERRAMLEDWKLYQPKMRICARDCLGLPAGTKLFEVNVPVFHLQLAEVSGKLKVVSAMTGFE